MKVDVWIDYVIIISNNRSRINKDLTSNILCILQVEEERDQYTIEISITEPIKKGDGMSAYMAYKVNTKVGNSEWYFRKWNDLNDYKM